MIHERPWDWRGILKRPWREASEWYLQQLVEDGWFPSGVPDLLYEKEIPAGPAPAGGADELHHSGGSPELQ